MESTKYYYNQQYERWMPWIEDKYLAWFGTDNKASYATKCMLLFVYLISMFLVLTTRSGAR